MSKTPLKGRIRVGCSGWSYKDWKGVFYTKGTKAGDYLEHYAKHFNTVEVDGSYYRAPSRLQTASMKSAVATSRPGPFGPHC